MEFQQMFPRIARDALTYDEQRIVDELYVLPASIYYDEYLEYGREHRDQIEWWYDLCQEISEDGTETFTKIVGYDSDNLYRLWHIAVLVGNQDLIEFINDYFD